MNSLLPNNGSEFYIMREGNNVPIVQIKNIVVESYLVDKFYRENVLGISQADMSALTNVSQSLISLHENGKWSSTASDAYEAIGIRRFFELVNFERKYSFKVNIGTIINGSVAYYLHKQYPEEVPYKKGRMVIRYADGKVMREE